MVNAVLSISVVNVYMRVVRAQKDISLDKENPERGNKDAQHTMYHKIAWLRYSFFLFYSWESRPNQRNKK